MQLCWEEGCKAKDHGRGEELVVEAVLRQMTVVLELVCMRLTQPRWDAGFAEDPKAVT